jgi:hypothetical protein
VAKTLSAAVPRKLQFPKAKLQIPNAKGQSGGSKGPVPNLKETPMTKANTDGWTGSEDWALRFPWDLRLGFWGFLGAWTLGFVWSLEIGVGSFFR